MDIPLPFDKVPTRDGIIDITKSSQPKQKKKPGGTEKEVSRNLPFFGTDIAIGTPPKPTVKLDASCFYRYNYDCNINKTFNFVKACIMIKLRHGKKPTKRLSSLSFVMNLPMEILFETFGHLHPVDLFNLGFVSKFMRQTIRSRSAIPLWTLVWERNSDMLDCPPNITYLRWADLMFGEAVCDNCQKYIAQPDFTYMRRYCTNCLSNEFFAESDELRSEVRLLVAGTLRTNGCDLEGRSASQDSSWCRRLKTDVWHIEEEIRKYQEACFAGVPGAQERLEAFCVTRIEEVKSTLKRAARYGRWLHGTYTQFSVWKSHSRRTVFRRITKKLRRLGYNKDDLTARTFDRNLLQEWTEQHVLRLNKRVIRQSWSTILSVADTCQRIAQDQARVVLVSCRSHLLQEAYERYCGQFPASKWHTFPPKEEVLSLESLQVIIQSPGDMAPTPNECDAAIQSHVTFIESWYSDNKTSIFKELVDPTSTLAPAEFMNLATSLYSCDICFNDCGEQTPLGECMFGWADLACHLEYPSHRVEVEPIRTAVVEKILAVLQLGPKTTTIEDLDKLNHRFVCRGCYGLPTGYRREIGRACFSWRELVRHILHHHEEFTSARGSTIGTWDVLCPEATTYVIRREPSNPTYRHKAWACNHCSFHIKQLVLRSEAVHHVQTLHGIRDVTTGRDVIYIPQIFLEEENTVMIPIEPHNYFCMVCPANIVRFYNDSRSVILHIRDKHGTQTGEENTHWKALELALSSPSPP